VHRPAPVECALPARDETIPDLPPNAGVEDFENDPACEASLKTCRIEQDDCTRDADCGAGYCVRTTREYMDYDDFEVMLDVHHRCYMPCSTDSDCGTDEVCACAYFTRNATRTSLPVGVCMAADCRMDADCGEGAFCSAPLTQAARGGPATELGPFHCQSPDDECHGPERCPVEDRNFCGNVATCVHNGDHLECGETDPDDNCG
jgi:hypothetical protein